MSDEFGPNFITITDEDGNDIELEYVDALEHNGVTYMAFFPTADTEEEAESAQDFGLVILKSVMENGEELPAAARRRHPIDSCPPASPPLRTVPSRQGKRSLPYTTFSPTFLFSLAKAVQSLYNDRECYSYLSK